MIGIELQNAPHKFLLIVNELHKNKTSDRKLSRAKLKKQNKTKSGGF